MNNLNLLSLFPLKIPTINEFILSKLKKSDLLKFK